jgi:lipoyl(octanoyl) transferase
MRDWSPMLIRHLGRCDWQATADAMRAFTEARSERTPDELWLAEHEPVFTQGVAGRAEHVHGASGIPVRQSNRGGQVTYHGPGQVVAYPLLDLRRQHIYVKEYVFRIEAAVLKVLESYGVTGHRVSGAPGLYVRLDDPFGHAALAGPVDPREPFRGLGKIAALGIKVSRHCSYHGVALNVAMDLEPFTRIDPCGYAGLVTVDLARLGVPATWGDVADRLAQRLVGQFKP